MIGRALEGDVERDFDAELRAPCAADCLKSSSVPSCGRMSLWPPSAEPMAQGLPTSSGCAASVLLTPLRLTRPMGWMGGKYSTSKPMRACRAAAPRRRERCRDGPAPNALERGNSSYQLLNCARLRSAISSSDALVRNLGGRDSGRDGAARRIERQRLHGGVSGRSRSSGSSPCAAAPPRPKIAASHLRVRRAAAPSMSAAPTCSAVRIGRILAPLEFAAPRFEVIDPGGHRVAVAAGHRRGEFGDPDVVDLRLHLDS
jgi:hypothetical protein